MLTDGSLDNGAPGFVAVIDGSEQAHRAVGPALALADWYGRPCRVVEVTGGPDDTETDLAVSLQLEDTRLRLQDVVSVELCGLETLLFELMSQGQIVVSAAFGVWAADGRLHGTLNGLVQHNAPAIIGIGPNVPAGWAPSSEGPIIVCVDASEHAHHIAEKLGPFLMPCRGRVVVAHVESESPPNATIAKEVASEINRRFGMPVEGKSFREDSATEGIAILASRLNSQLVITHSWHRPQSGQPSVTSTSLSSAAHAPCPVVILSD